MVGALDRKLLRDLTHLKGQVITIALVVASGIASYTGLQSTYASLQDSKTAYYERYRFGDVFARLKRAPDALAAQIADIPGVATAYTRVVEDGRIPLEDVEQPPIAQLVSIPDDGVPPLNALHLTEGRMPEPGNRSEALLLAKFAATWKIRPGDLLPVVMEGTLHHLRITGIVMSPEFVYPMPAGGGISPDESRFAALWMYRDVLAPLVQMDGAFNDVVLRLSPGVSERAVLAELDRVLEPYGGLGAVGREHQSSNYVLTSEIAQLESMATIIPAIFLGVAAFLLNVVLSRMVLLQRSQIAALKAVGYADRQIGLHYLKLVSVIVVLGALLGVGLGAYLGKVLTDLYISIFGFPSPEFRLGPRTVVVSLGVSVGAAVLGALVSVRQIAKLSPAAAMQPPAPAKYRKTVMEQIGLQKFVGQSGRMILRELERRPLRTALSAVGVASAVGILVVGRFNLDAVDYILTSQFEWVDRSDLTVTFSKTLPMRAERELAHLPGVYRSEGLRAVPVRLRAGQRWRDLSLMGHPDDAELFRILDSAGNVVPLPERGVVLTTLLGDLLGVKVGDTLRIEVREGERQTLEVPVAGFADEMIGLQVHLRLSELTRLLGEEPAISSAFLDIDPAQQEEITRRLNDMPNVISITSKQANIDKVREQMGDTVVVMTFIVTALAATIAVGVIYNNARIALSMRSRDLASLRVLGFTKREIAQILLGEIAVQVLIALPFGMLFGRWLTSLLTSGSYVERMRLPLVISGQTYAFAAVVALASALLSALLVRRQLNQLDLIGVLKARE